MRGVAEPCHGSVELPARADGGLSKPTWGAGVGPLSLERLKEQFVLQGLNRGGRRVTDTGTALEPAAAASCCQRASPRRG